MHQTHGQVGRLHAQTRTHPWRCEGQWSHTTKTVAVQGGFTASSEGKLCLGRPDRKVLKHHLARMLACHQGSQAGKGCACGRMGTNDTAAAYENLRLGTESHLAAWQGSRIGSHALHAQLCSEQQLGGHSQQQPGETPMTGLCLRSTSRLPQTQMLTLLQALLQATPWLCKPIKVHATGCCTRPQYRQRECCLRKGVWSDRHDASHCGNSYGS